MKHIKMCKPLPKLKVDAAEVSEEMKSLTMNQRDKKQKAHKEIFHGLGCVPTGNIIDRD